MPGLVLAQALVGTHWTLLDSNRRRCAFLRDAVIRLRLEGRVVVAETRAEEAGRSTAFRGKFAGITARGFGPPSVTAECGAPLLALGGTLIVSEPPDGAARWPVEGLAVLGLAPAGMVAAGARFAVLRKTAPTPERYPRKSGIPSKRPLF